MGSEEYIFGLSALKNLNFSIILQAEEKKLELAEEYLEQDASMFDEFLKENDRNAVEAIKLYVGYTSYFSLIILCVSDFIGFAVDRPMI